NCMCYPDLSSFFYTLATTTNISTPSLLDALPIYHRHGHHDQGEQDPTAAADPPVGHRRPRLSRNSARAHELAARAHRLAARRWRSEEHTSELQSRFDLVCRLLLEKKNITTTNLSV